MKIRINKYVISKLNPCNDRHENYIKYYNDFDGDILKFLELEKITAQDKIWVAVRVLPRDILEVFAIDCAFAAAYAADAAAYAADAYAAYAAAYSAAYAADAAAYAAADDAYAAAAAYAAYADVAAYAADAAYAAARNEQVEVLKYLIKTAV